MDTKTTEWEAELKRRIEHGSDENLGSIVPFVQSLLHQSRTELMRKCLERVPSDGSESGSEQWNRALIKLAEDEGIEL